MAEVSNQKIIDRYKEVLTNRSHDVIVMNLAIEILEADLKKSQQECIRVTEENESLKREVDYLKDIKVISGDIAESRE